MSNIFLSICLVAVLIFATVTHAYLPGVTPNTFHDKENVVLKANKITSTSTPLQYDYYDLPFCRRRGKGGRSKAENLGERLSGESTTTSPYELKMKVDESCIVLCRKAYKQTDVKFFKQMIDQDYRVHWSLDSLPVHVRNEKEGFVERGYPIGFLKETSDSKGGSKKHYLNNHVSITVKYSEIPEEFDGARIVGFEVAPYSIKHDDSDQQVSEGGQARMRSCSSAMLSSSPSTYQPVEAANEEVFFTYDVKWEKSDVLWSQRWDIYLKGNPDDEIHYFAIINPLVIVLFLTGVVAMIMLRTLHKDISSYNEMQTLEEAQEESGWKLVHGDVFRTPQYSPLLFSVLVGTGVQILAMCISTNICALAGLTSPVNRGALATTLVVLYVFMGSFSGYSSARIYKLLGGKNWKTCTLMTGTLYPGVMGFIFLCINTVVALEGSSTAAPFTALLAVLALLVCISLPLVFIGSYFGFRRETISTPVRTNQIARHIPDEMWYSNPLFGIALGGILPFGAVCIEMYYLMSAMWLHQLYVLLILVLTCAEISIVLCYFQLCNEDYRWWWRSYLSSASSGLYLFLFTVWYYWTKLHISGIVPSILYFAYMSMISITFSFVTGSIGFLACLWFVRKIYGAIKVD